MKFSQTKKKGVFMTSKEKRVFANMRLVMGSLEVAHNSMT